MQVLNFDDYKDYYIEMRNWTIARRIEMMIHRDEKSKQFGRPFGPYLSQSLERQIRAAKGRALLNPKFDDFFDRYDEYLEKRGFKDDWIDLIYDRADERVEILKKQREPGVLYGCH